MQLETYTGDHFGELVEGLAQGETLLFPGKVGQVVDSVICYP